MSEVDPTQHLHKSHDRLQVTPTPPPPHHIARAKEKEIKHY